MTRLIIHINDPKQEKVVEDLLEGVKGIAVERDPAKPKKKPLPRSATKVRAKATPKRPLTPREKKFVKDLKHAVQDMKDHIAGKKKLQTLDEFLDEL